MLRVERLAREYKCLSCDLYIYIIGHYGLVLLHTHG